MKAPPEDKPVAKDPGEAAVKLENRRNRSIIADAVKQMVLVVISLGFTKAFDILLAKPEKPADGGGADLQDVPHLVLAACDKGSGICLMRLLVFCVYLLFGTRFLLTSWLYLSTTYRDDNLRNPKILPDAIGISLTGVAIGLQSYYASEKSIPDFFLMVCVVLLIDVVSSVVSAAINRVAVKGEGLRREWLWICNNLIFGIAMFAVLKYEPDQHSDYLLIILACLNSSVSFGITWKGYFRLKRDPQKIEGGIRLRRLKRDELVRQIKEELSGDG